VLPAAPLDWLRSMVIPSDAARHAARLQAPEDGAEDGIVAGFDGTPAGLVTLGAAAVGAAAVGAAAVGADVGTAGAPVAAGGSPPPAGWLALEEPHAASTDDTATAAPTSSAALENANDDLNNDVDMG
jgi:hypothetical protein